MSAMSRPREAEQRFFGAFFQKRTLFSNFLFSMVAARLNPVHAAAVSCRTALQ
jgi:hypothetical protein